MVVVLDFIVLTAVSSCSATICWTDLFNVSLTASFTAFCIARAKLPSNAIDLMISTFALPSLSARDESLSRLRFLNGLMKCHGWLIEGCLTPSMNGPHTLHLARYG